MLTLLPYSAVSAAPAKPAVPSDNCTADTAAAICDAIRASGLSVEDAALLNGVAPDQLESWVESVPEFAFAVRRARAEFKRDLLQGIREGRKEWRALGWLLSKSFPQEYGSSADRRASASSSNAVANGTELASGKSRRTSRATKSEDNERENGLSKREQDSPGTASPATGSPAAASEVSAAEPSPSTNSAPPPAATPPPSKPKVFRPQPPMGHIYRFTLTSNVVQPAIYSWKDARDLDPNFGPHDPGP